MCMFCERRKDVKFGWEQPKIPYGSKPLKADESISGNAIEDPNTWEARIHDYQTCCPNLILTKDGYFNGTGVGTITIPIHYCIVCGRKLGDDKNDHMDYLPKPYMLIASNGLEVNATIHPSLENAQTAMLTAVKEHCDENIDFEQLTNSYLSDIGAHLSPVDDGVQINDDWTWLIVETK